MTGDEVIDFTLLRFCDSSFNFGDCKRLVLLIIEKTMVSSSFTCLIAVHALASFDESCFESTGIRYACRATRASRLAKWSACLMAAIIR